MLKNSHKILIIIFCLLAFGIIMVYSSSFFRAESARQIQDGYYFFKKQLIIMGFSILVMLIVSRIPYQFWGKISPLLLLLCLGMLILVFIPSIGHIAGGSRRWLRISSFGFQPSETAKIVLVIFIAAFISRYPEQIRSFKKGFIPLCLVIALTVSLIMIEPDIGTAFFIALLTGILLIIGGVRITYILPVGLLVGSLVFYIVTLCYPHIQMRLTVFFSPTADASGKGYQINQALIGLGAGGITGNGLGLSYQKLFYLPQQHTDFIFSIIGEELGLIGVIIVVLLFFAFLWYGKKIASETSDRLGFLLAIGITLMIVLQAIINIAVVTALLPTKGISLPFISYGGSGLLVFMFAIGILINIARQSETSNKISLK
ncbi:MAG: putative lipid II flippase FtsW [Planctomycetota bacterium]|nr:putative lipid II flippase FtsW [Planctomycetota bacterium]MDI6788495.1 putative lipid II flippase FtsW [Planctomycetota bacterium]